VYQWTFNGNNISYGTASNLTLTNIHGSDAGLYAVLVSNSFGSIPSSNALLTVTFPPVITIQPHDLRLLEGTSGQLSVQATGSPVLAYQWQFVGTNIDGATSSTYSLTSALTNQTGQYDVVVTNNYGSATSVIATLTIETRRAPQFQNVFVMPDGSRHMTVVGLPGGVYTVDESSNLVDWLQVTCFTNVTGNYDFIDYSAATNSIGFYRSRQVP
jgi:hypothetical protein